MPKIEAKHNPQKPYFTDFTLAGVQDRSVYLRFLYNEEQLTIAFNRAERKDKRFWDTRIPVHPLPIRAGYPKMRQRDPEAPSLRGNAFSKFTKRFKIVERTSGVVKVFILHYTRGWKAFA